MGRAQAARRLAAKAQQQKKNQPKIGQKATLNGKPVIYAGGDYGYQSPASFNKLKKEGQLALGAGLARRAQQVFDKAEQFRHDTFGTAEEGPLAKQVREWVENDSPLGLLSRGEGIATDAVSNQLGISPLIGGLVLGQLVPGPGGPTRATRSAARRASAKGANRGKLGHPTSTRPPQGTKPDGSRLNPVGPNQIVVQRNGQPVVVAPRRPGEPPGRARRSAQRAGSQVGAEQAAAKAAAATQGSPNVQGPNTREFQARVDSSDLSGSADFNSSSTGKKSRQQSSTILDGAITGGPSEVAPTRQGPRERPTQSRTGRELAQLRDEMARADRSRSRNPDVGVQVEPSFDSNGNRIVYQGDSLNVRTDPDTGRLRGRDTAEPRNARKDFLQDGNPDFQGEPKGKFGQGLRKEKQKGVSGDSGNAANSAPKALRRELEAEFDQLHPAKARRASRAGQRRARGTNAQIANRQKRKDDWVNRQLNNAVAEHTASNFPNRPPTGNVPRSDVTPGARYRGDIEKLTEAQKTSGTPNPDSKRSSVRNAPDKATDNRELVSRNDRANRQNWRTARGSEVSAPTRRTEQALEQQRRRAQARARRQPPNQGPTVDSKGTRLDRQVQEEMQGRRRFDPERQRLESQRDPQLQSDMESRVRHLRKSESFTGFEGTKTDLKKIPGIYSLDEVKRLVREGELTQSQIDGSSRFVHKGEVFIETPGQPRGPRTTKALVEEGAEKGEFKPRRRDREPDRGRTQPSKDYEPKGERYVNERAEDYNRRARSTRRSRGQFATDAEVKAALREVDTEQITRSDGIDPGDGGRFREHNARIRETNRSRLAEFEGQRLEPELIDPARREMPNRARPTDGARHEPQTFGDTGTSSFKGSGELKGVRGKGRTKNRGRSTKQTKRAERLLEKLTGRRETGKSPMRSQRAKKRNRR